MKKTIKLNERELHRLIMEAINELDWKTYASAADKLRKSQDGDNRANFNRANKLDKAASKALSNKFNRNLETIGNSYNDERQVIDVDAGMSEPSLETGPMPLGYNYISTPERDWANGIQKEYKEGDIRYGHLPNDDSRYDFETEDSYRQRLRNNEIGKELDNYTHGNYVYKPFKEGGKGWQLKSEALEESNRRTFRKYLR